MNKTIIIRVDGSTETHEYKDDARPSLSDLQAAVGGYIEAVPLFNEYEGQYAVMYCNEEGKLQGLARNETAQKLWEGEVGEPITRDELNGDVIIVTGTEDFVDG